MGIFCDGFCTCICIAVLKRFDAFTRRASGNNGGIDEKWALYSALFLGILPGSIYEMARYRKMDRGFVVGGSGNVGLGKGKGYIAITLVCLG